MVCKRCPEDRMLLCPATKPTSRAELCEQDAGNRVKEGQKDQQSQDPNPDLLSRLSPLHHSCCWNHLTELGAPIWMSQSTPGNSYPHNGPYPLRRPQSLYPATQQTVYWRCRRSHDLASLPPTCCIPRAFCHQQPPSCSTSPLFDSFTLPFPT